MNFRAIRDVMAWLHRITEPPPFIPAHSATDLPIPLLYGGADSKSIDAAPNVSPRAKVLDELVADDMRALRRGLDHLIGQRDTVWESMDESYRQLRRPWPGVAANS